MKNYTYNYALKMKIFYKKNEMIFNIYEVCCIYFTCDSNYFEPCL